MSRRRFSFIRSIIPENALNFSRRTRFVRESMIERIYPPRIILPMKQHYGQEAVPIVEVGDTVMIGQCVGAPVPGTFSAPVHSGISGTVTEIKTITLPNGVVTKAVVIESDRKRTNHPSIHPRTNINIDAKTVMGIVKNAGIVGMGGEGIPTIYKINRARKYKVNEVLVNCLQSEPYATCDLYRLCETPEYVVMGAVAMAGVIGATKIRFLISESRKMECDFLKNAIETIKAEHPQFQYEVVLFKDRFPQGHFRLVARALYSIELKQNDTLENKCNAVLFNCSTCNSVWEAINDGMPSVNRVVTIAGDTTSSHNVLVPFGTPIKDVLSKMSPVFSSCRVVWGNALTGLSCTDMDTPMIKTTSAITMIKMIESPKTPCIHCGMCYDACPVDITPNICYNLIENGFDNKAELENAMKCIACGACSYVCPAGINLTGIIAGFVAKNKATTTDENKNLITYSKEDIDVTDVSLLEEYAEVGSNSDDEYKDDESIELPFEGGRFI